MKHYLSTGERLHFTEHRAYRTNAVVKGKNKMQGMCSLNTSSITNKFCQAMSKDPKAVCHNCYARKLELFRKEKLGDCFFKNGQTLVKPLKDSDVPQLNLLHLRFSAFGELEDTTHYFNFVAIAEANSKTTCVLWTKRADIIRKHKVNLPNLIHIYSAPHLNVIEGDFNLFDKIFTVYNKKFIEQNNVDINCEQYCIECMKCYTHNDIKYINERIRSA